MIARWDDFKDNKENYDFGTDMVEFLLGIRPSLTKSWAHYDRVRILKNESIFFFNEHLVSGIII